jgi:hypothetical protein
VPPFQYVVSKMQRVEASDVSPVGILEILTQDDDFMKLFECDNDDCGSVKDIKKINDIVHCSGSKFYVRRKVLCVLKNVSK